MKYKNLNSHCLLFIVFVFSSLFFFFQIPKIINADNLTDNINATTQLSICGNGVIEGEEDCEGDNLNNKSCKSIGYEGGGLSCDIACSFITTNCTPTTTPTTINTIQSATTSSPETSAGSFIANSPFPSTTPAIEKALPPILKIFDINRNGRVESSEVYEAVTIWVENWKNTLTNSQNQDLTSCDVNSDGACDISDLSILLYYIEK